MSEFIEDLIKGLTLIGAILCLGLIAFGEPSEIDRIGNIGGLAFLAWLFMDAGGWFKEKEKEVSYNKYGK